MRRPERRLQPWPTCGTYRGAGLGETEAVRGSHREPRLEPPWQRAGTAHPPPPRSVPSPPPPRAVNGAGTPAPPRGENPELLSPVGRRRPSALVSAETRPRNLEEGPRPASRAARAPAPLDTSPGAADSRRGARGPSLGRGGLSLLAPDPARRPRRPRLPRLPARDPQRPPIPLATPSDPSRTPLATTRPPDPPATPSDPQRPLTDSAGDLHQDPPATPSDPSWTLQRSRPRAQPDPHLVASASQLPTRGFHLERGRGPGAGGPERAVRLRLRPGEARGEGRARLPGLPRVSELPAAPPTPLTTTPWPRALRPGVGSFPPHS
ncbi:uncharacterized protein LOC125753331 [Canis lupus dingo]|uniref:uncharacterized protein LOC125753331 n=1 Tax=Canis lupus dingo TaxID=286419 RepID=UPI0020C3CF71|nr:uncharacterized protein LOC125753331 [Canis lupus dingo]